MGTLPLVSEAIDLSDETIKLEVTGGMFVDGAITQKLMDGDSIASDTDTSHSRISYSAENGIETFSEATRMANIPTDGGMLVIPGLVAPSGLAGMVFGPNESGYGCSITVSTGMNGTGMSVKCHRIPGDYADILFSLDGEVLLAAGWYGMSTGTNINLPDGAKVDTVDISDLNDVVQVGPTSQATRLDDLEAAMSAVESRINVLWG